MNTNRNIIILMLFLGFLGNINTSFSQKSVKKVFVKKKKIVKKRTLTYSQICGNITKVTGNQLPDPDQPINKGRNIACEILIYKLTKQTDTEGDGTTLFKNIKTKIVKKIMTNKDGRYCVNLPIGKYSIFVNEPGYGLFANSFDGEMNINPVEIKKGKNADFNIQINHSAAF